MSNPLRLTFWSGVGSVTGANFLLEGEGRILIDCGLIQGDSESEKLNAAAFPYDPRTIDFLFITHAHLDHIGRVGKLVKDGFSGVIYSTPATKDLAAVMLEDAVKVMRSKREESGEEPLYEEEHVSKALSLWKTLDYDHKIESVTASGLTVEALDAGHILGSAMYRFTHDGKRIIFTGDSGNSPSPLLCDTESVAGANYLVMDSVYGNKNHEPKEERDAKFGRVVSDSISHGGTLVIPAFSLERTQVILYELNCLIEAGLIPSVPVFLDSPLATKVTEIYRQYQDKFNDEVKKQIASGDDIFNFPKLSVVHHARESEELDRISGAKIIIAGSGMSEGGRVVSHEERYLPDPKSTILLMGYQAVGTLGRRIQDVPHSVEIGGKTVPVRARIEMISGYSSHKDSDCLLDMVAEASETLKKVFVVMGEPEASLYLVQRLRDYLGVDAIYPERGRSYEIA